MERVDPRFLPPATKGHVSVARLSNWWYIACESHELKKKPKSVMLLGTPIVLFRNGDGEAGALLDRCPHRNVPLSLGKVTKDTGNLECPYHGWQFDKAGTCRLVPGLVDGHEAKGRRADAFPVREENGFVWVWPDLEVEPDKPIFPLPLTDAKGYTTVVRQVEVECSVHAAAENALDVPHTAYLHKGLFRGGEKNQIHAVVSRWHDRVECQYLGEPRPPGIVARLISPSGGIVEHWDRFFLPSVAQVEYKLGTENHFLVTSVLTPVSDFRTRMFAIISFRTRVPGKVLKPLLEPLAMRIFKQDADILKLQTETIQRFGGEQYMSTDIDILGPHIWRLLRQAERGELDEVADPVVKELDFLA